jgi:hypothetical protein
MPDWTFDVGEFYVGASRGGHVRIGLCLEEDGDLEVDLEAGSGYLREHITDRIPAAVLTKLLEGRGYVVTAPPSSTTTETK